MTAEILLSVLIPVAVAVAFGLFIWRWHIAYKLRKEISTKGTRLYKLDLKNRKYMLIDAVGTKRELGKKYNRPGVWRPFSEFQDFFKSETAANKLLEAIHKIERGEQRQTLSFKIRSINYQKRTTEFKVQIDPYEDDDDYVLKMTWRVLLKEAQIKHQVNQMDKQEVADYRAKYKSFVAFKINKGKETAPRLLDLATRISRHQQLNYFKSSGFIIFVFFGNSNKEVRRYTNRFVDSFIKNGFKRGANHLFDGSAFAISQKVSSMKTMNAMVASLEYFINVSIETKNNFVSYDGNYDKDDFHKFVEASKSFRLAIREGSIKVNKASVKGWKSKRKKFEYVYPTIEGINERLLSRIMRNSNNKDMLIDRLATDVAITKLHASQALVDVNFDWLVIHKDQMVYKNAVYIINFDQSKKSDEMQLIIDELVGKGFVFGLRVSQYNEDIATIVSQVPIKLMLIDKSIWGNNGLLTTEALINLMTIRKIAESKDISLVYEHPSEFVDEIMAKKIGLQYFFDVTQIS